jgi:pimeloyl-ACP methyl ester carboxylesterase
MTQSRMQHITSTSPRISYVQGGDGHLPKAILLHGWIASHALYAKCWDELDKLLCYRAIDLPGFGDSDKPDHTQHAYDPAWYAQQLERIVADTGWGKVIVVGHSMGGMAAMAFAAAHPHLVERLILVDSAGHEMPPPLMGRLLQAPVIGRALFMALGGSTKALSDFLRNDVYHVQSVFHLDTVRNMQRCLRLPGGMAAAYATMMNMVSPGAVRKFMPTRAKVAVPTRVLWGEHDRLFPVEVCGRAITSAIPGATMEVISGAGHEPPMETPQAFMDALRRALA